MKINLKVNICFRISYAENNSKKNETKSPSIKKTLLSNIFFEIFDCINIQFDNEKKKKKLKNKTSIKLVKIHNNLHNFLPGLFEKKFLLS